MLERTTLADCAKNPREDAIHAQQNIGVPETKDQEPLLLKPAIARYIVLMLRKRSVLTAVEFDDDTQRERHEIHDMRSDRCLTSEFDSQNLLPTKPSPELPLSIR